MKAPGAGRAPGGSAASASCGTEVSPAGVAIRSGRGVLLRLEEPPVTGEVLVDRVSVLGPTNLQPLVLGDGHRLHATACGGEQADTVRQAQAGRRSIWMPQQASGQEKFRGKLWGRRGTEARRGHGTAPRVRHQKRLRAVGRERRGIGGGGISLGRCAREVGKKIADRGPAKDGVGGVPGGWRRRAGGGGGGSLRRRPRNSSKEMKKLPSGPTRESCINSCRMALGGAAGSTL